MFTPIDQAFDAGLRSKEFLALGPEDFLLPVLQKFFCWWWFIFPLLR
jgi:hypothetical protein